MFGTQDPRRNCAQNDCAAPETPEPKNLGYKLVKTKDGKLWPLINLEELFVHNPSAVVEEWAKKHKLEPVEQKPRSSRGYVQFRRSLCVYECW